MLAKRIRIITAISGIFGVLIFGFSNCNGYSPNGQQDSASNPNSAATKACTDSLLSTFELSYYQPIFQDPALCVRCHTEGGVSPYKFASSNLSIALNTFLQVSADHVDANAVNPAHAPGVTSPTLQTRITAARALWDPAFAAYQSCMANSVSIPDLQGQMTLANRNTPELYFGDGRTVTLSWDLSGEDVVPASARFPAIFLLDVAVDYAGSGTTATPAGYVFTNPRIQMLTGDKEIQIDGLAVLINNVKGAGMEPFLNATKVARGSDPTIIYSGSVSSALPVVSNGDKIGVSITSFSLRDRTDNPPVPPVPTVAPQKPYTNQTKPAVAIGNDGTARRWCLTSQNIKPASSAAPCPGFETALDKGWSTTRPTIFDLTAVAPAAGQTVTMYLWVINSDLKMNAAPGIGQVTFDNVAPAAATYSSLSLAGQTQIADLVGLGDFAETVSWCVLENAVKTSVQTAGGCQFSATKPAFVGLKGGGTRYVSVFVRDQAGNTSMVSTINSVNNTYGQISFAQLSDATNGPRAVFANSCVSCHGSTNTNVPFWDATSYANSVSMKSGILKQIGASQTVAHKNLISARDAALISLWFSQTSTPVAQ